MTPNPEIGRKLRADELKEGSVVVLLMGERGSTMRVNKTGQPLIEFYGVGGTAPGPEGDPPIEIYVWLVPRADGTLADDTGQEVEVYEYLGK